MVMRRYEIEEVREEKKRKEVSRRTLYLFTLVGSGLLSLIVYAGFKLGVPAFERAPESVKMIPLIFAGITFIVTFVVGLIVIKKRVG